MGILRLSADLHNHSCLSPCGDLSMSPERLAETAQARGIGILALTDHNASLNCPPFALACAARGIIPLFGMELCSAEEVHLLALFSSPKAALQFGAEIHSLLPRLPWNPEVFGDQAVVDAEEKLLELHETWLGAALDASFEDLALRGSLAKAIVIPAHVDRAMFSVQSQLGFLPSGPYDAVESVFSPIPSLSGGHSVISGSDAHYPEHIGRRPFGVELPEAQTETLINALDRYMEIVTSRRVRDINGQTNPEFGGYEELFLLPEVIEYPEVEAYAFLETLREALRAGRVLPSFARGYQSAQRM